MQRPPGPRRPRRLATRHVQITRLEEASIPLHLIAWDLLSGQEARRRSQQHSRSPTRSRSAPRARLHTGPPATQRPQTISRLAASGSGAPAAAAASETLTRLLSPAPAPPSRPGAIRHRRRNHHPARRQSPAHPAHQLHPRPATDHPGAYGRQEQLWRPTTPTPPGREHHRSPRTTSRAAPRQAPLGLPGPWQNGFMPMALSMPPRTICWKYCAPGKADGDCQSPASCPRVVSHAFPPS